MKETTKVLLEWTERDLTAAAAELAPAYGREEEVARVIDLLGSGRHPVLAGESGVGKTAVVHEIVRRARAGQRVPGISGKQVLQISLKNRASALSKPSNQMGPEFQKLVRALVDSAGSVVPFFRDLHVAYSYDLEPQLVHLAARFEGVILGEADPSRLRAMFESEADLDQHYMAVNLAEPTLDRMRSLLAEWEAGQDVSFEPEALDAAIELSHRFLTRGRLPRKALEVLQQSATAAGAGARVTEAAVIRRFQETYRVPALLVDPAVPFDPEATRALFRDQVLEQDEAVDAAVRMMSLIKAGLSDPRRPFGAFLFVGPTGVGKTRLAQLLAEHLFCSQDQLLRLNMADYPRPEDCFTVFGTPGAYQAAARRGKLTVDLQGYPFAVLLLDELEKAHPSMHDRFLQLFDEGAFINGAGETVSCRALVIIATSNAGAELYRGDQFGFTGYAAGELERELDRRLLQHFRLEFVNRFDQVVHFHPLTRDGVRQIALREIRAVLNRSGIRASGRRIEVADSVLDWVTAKGYHPHYGARFLRRTIERHVTSALAQCLVSEAAGDVLVTVENDVVVGRRKDPPAPCTEPQLEVASGVRWRLARSKASITLN